MISHFLGDHERTQSSLVFRQPKLFKPAYARAYMGSQQGSFSELFLQLYVPSRNLGLGRYRPCRLRKIRAYRMLAFAATCKWRILNGIRTSTVSGWTTNLGCQTSPASSLPRI